MSLKRSLLGILTFLLLSAISFHILGSNGPGIDYKTLANATVSVVRMDSKSGGTGVVMTSSSEQSFVLTNNHVCEVVVHGGWVIKDEGDKHAVLGFKRSRIHDLCMVQVAGDLRVQTTVAAQPPALYDEAIVAGHPALYPTIITKGHFTHIIQIPVMYGFRPCTEEEKNGPPGLLCLLNGGISIIRTLDSQVTSATIMPGSSGSAVYNSNGELAALIFAGAGQLGYGFAVPYAYIRNFLDVELKSILLDRPNQNSSEGEISDSTSQNCNEFKDLDVQKLCNLINLIKKVKETSGE